MKLNVVGLLNDIKKQGSALVALSGGLDSSVVAALAQKALGTRAVAVTIDTDLLGAADSERASSIAARIGTEHLIHRANPLSATEVRPNKLDRRYHCKSMVLSGWRNLLSNTR